MNISWYGHSCFKLDFEIDNKEVSVVIDPYDESIGYKLPALSADIVLVTHQHKDHDNVKAVSFKDKKSAMVINSPGEYEVKKVFVQGVESFHDNKEGEERGKNIIYRIQSKGISFAHLGDLGGKLTTKQLDVIEGVDVLFIPIGGKYTINASQAVKVMNQVSPKIVIPMHYKLPKLTLDIEGLDKFLHEVSVSDPKKLSELKVNSRSLNNENILVKILKPLVK